MNIIAKIKKYFTPLNIVIAIQVLVVLGACSGFLLKEVFLFLTGLLLFYVLFAPPADALVLAVFSIPLYVALPVADSFDFMANWRPVIVFLSISFLWLAFRRKDIFRFPGFNRAGMALAAIFLISLLSLSVAAGAVIGLKKIIFFINIFFLFAIVRYAVGEKIINSLVLLKTTAAAGAVVLAAGFIQLLMVFFIPLYDFWQWWDFYVIDAYYGRNLADLLSYSNTWFSYYENALPTLRMFSVFPDSHSFAMFCVVLLPVLIYLWRETKEKKYGFLAITALSAIAFSGTRGAWLSGLLMAGLVFILPFFRRWLKKEIFSSERLKILARVFLIFLLAFPVSFLILSFSRIGNIPDGSASHLSFSFLERAKSIMDREETSNLGRLAIWGRTLQSVADHPFLGVGIGNFPVVLGESLKTSKMGASAHCLYLDVAAEMGIFGLLAFLAWFFFMLKDIFRMSEKSSFHFFLLFFLAWIMFYNFFDVVLLNDKVLLLFASVLGIAYGSGKETAKN